MAFWKIAKVEEESGHKKSWIYSKVKTGEFPAPVRLSTRCVAWIDSEITAWQEARIKASRDPLA